MPLTGSPNFVPIDIKLLLAILADVEFRNWRCGKDVGLLLLCVRRSGGAAWKEMIVFGWVEGA